MDVILTEDNYINSDTQGKYKLKISNIDNFSDKHQTLKFKYIVGDRTFDLKYNRFDANLNPDNNTGKFTIKDEEFILPSKIGYSSIKSDLKSV